jgi:hypothetical protein
MKRIMVMLALTVAVAGCSEATTEDASSDLRYFRDNRTKLCFASASRLLNQNSSTLTVVPCTAEVMKLVR